MTTKTGTNAEAMADMSIADTIDVDDRRVRLAVRSKGDGQPFIWGHGLMGSMAQEDEVAIFEWSDGDAGIRWVRYDARGHGDSQATYDPEAYRWLELARDLLALADALDAPRVALGVVSMGCATSLHAAVAAPERVSALVLVAPPTAWKTRPRQALVYRLLASLVAWLGIGPLRMLSSLEPPGERSPALVQMQRALVRHLGEADARALVAALRGAAASDLPPRTRCALCACRPSSSRGRTIPSTPCRARSGSCGCCPTRRCTWPTASIPWPRGRASCALIFIAVWVAGRAAP